MGSRWAWECGRPVFCAFVSRSRYREGQATLDIGPNEVRTEQPCRYVVRRISFSTGFMSAYVRGDGRSVRDPARGLAKTRAAAWAASPGGSTSAHGHYVSARATASAPPRGHHRLDGSLWSKIGSREEGCKFVWAPRGLGATSDFLRAQSQEAQVPSTRACDLGLRANGGLAT